MLCFQVFSPFLSLMTWALILAVTLYPLHQSVAAKIGGRQGLAATLLVLLGVVVVVMPTAALMNALGDSVHRLVSDVQNNTLQVPPPREGVAEWPLVGEKVHTFWTKAYTELPALVQSMQPKIGNLAKAALGFVAGIAGELLHFLASLAVAGIMMAFGEGGRARSARSSRESPTGTAEGVRRTVHGDHPRGRQGRARRRVPAGHHRRHLPAHRRHTVAGGWQSWASCSVWRRYRR